MTTQQAQCLTLAFLAATVAVVIATDVWLCCTFGPDATISRVMRRGFERWPILYPVFWFVLGVLAGHIGLPTE